MEGGGGGREGMAGTFEHSDEDEQQFILGKIL